MAFRNSQDVGELNSSRVSGETEADTRYRGGQR